MKCHFLSQTALIVIRRLNSHTGHYLGSYLGTLALTQRWHTALVPLAPLTLSALTLPLAPTAYHARPLSPTVRPLPAHFIGASHAKPSAAQPVQPADYSAIFFPLSINSSIFVL